MPRIMYRITLYRILIFYLIVPCGLWAPRGLGAESSPHEPEEHQLLSGKPFIYKLNPQRQDGRGYKLIYVVDAPLDVFWKFKTDFDNDFLQSNKYIRSHRFIRRQGNEVITVECQIF